MEKVLSFPILHFIVFRRVGRLTLMGYRLCNRLGWRLDRCGILWPKSRGPRPEICVQVPQTDDWWCRPRVHQHFDMCLNVLRFVWVTWVSEDVWEMSGVRAHSGARPIRQNSYPCDRHDVRQFTDAISGHVQTYQTNQTAMTTDIFTGTISGHVQSLSVWSDHEEEEYMCCPNHRLHTNTQTGRL